MQFAERISLKSFKQKLTVFIFDIVRSIKLLSLLKVLITVNYTLMMIRQILQRRYHKSKFFLLFFYYAWRMAGLTT